MGNRMHTDRLKTERLKEETAEYMWFGQDTEQLHWPPYQKGSCERITDHTKREIKIEKWFKITTREPNSPREYCWFRLFVMFFFPSSNYSFNFKKVKEARRGDPNVCELAPRHQWDPVLYPNPQTSKTDRNKWKLTQKRGKERRKLPKTEKERNEKRATHKEKRTERKKKEQEEKKASIV